MCNNIKIYLGVLLLAMFIILSETNKTYASVITGETHLGGFSYYQDIYVSNGGDMNDLISDVYKVSDEERNILYRIVEAEVTGEGNEDYYKAKCNVISCILSRVENGWGKTIKDVVFQHKQFTPILDGRYYTVTVTEQTTKAVDSVLKHGKTHSCEYFCTRNCQSYSSGFHSTLEHVFDDVVHAYFRERRYD